MVCLGMVTACQNHEQPARAAASSPASREGTPPEAEATQSDVVAAGAIAPSTPGPSTPAASVPPSAKPSLAMQDKLDPSKMTDADWKAKLPPLRYHVLREKGTERAFSGKYWNTKTPGRYRCGGCGEVLFDSDAKFDSGCGWPSFYEPVGGLKDPRIKEQVDTSHGMTRIEVLCATCGGHLGHVFPDAPDQPTGMRYCINSAAIDLEPESEADQK